MEETQGRRRVTGSTEASHSARAPRQPDPATSTWSRKRSLSAQRGRRGSRAVRRDWSKQGKRSHRGLVVAALYLLLATGVASALTEMIHARSARRPAVSAPVPSKPTAPYLVIMLLD